MGDVIDLQDRQLTENQELIADLCRFRENLLTEKFIRRKYRLDNATWERLGNDEGNALIEKIEEESVRRTRDGSTKRELAQKHIVRGPDVLSSILMDDTANARHRIDSCKVLNDLASNGPGDPAPAADRFIISIVLNSDTGPNVVEHYNKSIAVNPDDVDPNDMPHLAAIAAKKPTDDGNGESL